MQKFIQRFPFLSLFILCLSSNFLSHLIHLNLSSIFLFFLCPFYVCLSGHVLSQLSHLHFRSSMMYLLRSTPRTDWTSGRRSQNRWLSGCWGCYGSLSTGLRMKPCECVYHSLNLTQGLLDSQLGLLTTT